MATFMLAPPCCASLRASTKMNLDGQQAVGCASQSFQSQLRAPAGWFYGQLYNSCRPPFAVRHGATHRPRFHDLSTPAALPERQDMLRVTSKIARAFDVLAVDVDP